MDPFAPPNRIIEIATRENRNHIEAIYLVKYVDAYGVSHVETKEKIAERINRGERFVSGGGLYPPPVHTEYINGHWCIRSQANGLIPDNLLSLPRFDARVSLLSDALRM
ncbi:DUF3892 domain-containing protein [Labrys neptuniae]|uniref:DUF3892 domain-containing protein n=1 Tax=Labrys neptuniae TaxID=376174 RepID=UPI00289061ED|nr:DUF3892 domain-containing protein [Labrys neptuniae]MDT3382526.1 DUF3892 domain-containing protein [Labrys neptuniae]